MAKSQTYVVSFSPATRTDYGFTTDLDIGGKYPRHKIDAATLPALEAEIRRLAAEFGQTCTAFINLADRKARKPAGFDAWRSKLQVIDVVAAA